MNPASVRAEPVEALPFTPCLAPGRTKEEQSFDKLRTNGPYWIMQ